MRQKRQQLWNNWFDGGLGEMTVQENLLLLSEKIKNEINCQLPAKVMQVNEDGTVNVLAIRNDEIEDCVITVPVIYPETARAYIMLKIKKGDRGVIKFCDKSIEEYRFGNENYNGDERCHSISDGIFQLGFLPSNEKFVFPDGEIVIGLKNSQFILSVNETGDFTIKAKSVIINSASTSINGDVSVNGTVTVSEDVIGGGISLKNHTHDYNPGPGGPTPTQPPK